MSLYSERDLVRITKAVADPDGNWRTLGAVAAGAQTCTSASTTLYTPSSGNKLRLRWLSLSSLSDGTECLVTVKFGSSQTIYLWGLPAPGAFSRTSTREATNANDALIVTLSPSGGPVYVNYEVEELTP